LGWDEPTTPHRHALATLGWHEPTAAPTTLTGTLAALGWREPTAAPTTLTGMPSPTSAGTSPLPLAPSRRHEAVLAPRHVPGLNELFTTEITG
jgi:hypothetical protein